MPASLEEAEALTRTFHPDLQAARFAVRQAEFDVKAAMGESLPTLNLEAGVSYGNDVFTSSPSNDENTSAQVGVSGSVPIWTGGRNDALVRQAQAVLDQRLAEVHDTARLLRQQTALAWANLEVARASIVAARQQIEAAQLAFEGVREEATLGARTTLDVLDAEQELVTAKVELVDSLRDEYVAAYELLAAVGSLTVEHLGLDVTRYDPNAYVAKVDDSPYTYERNESTEWSSRWKP